ncbi:MAG: hypothetical protein C4321_08385, partial [Chloroflexota bacterium]
MRPGARTVAVAVVVAVSCTAAYRVPPSAAWLRQHAPVGIVVTGVILGTVTGLLAVGLVLLWRASRFVNFAYGSMGSLVGVLGIGMHLEHGWPFFAVLPLAVVAGGLLGCAVEAGVVRRFRNSSRLVATVATIGLAQVLGGLELLGSRAIGFTSLTGGFEVPLRLRIDLGVKTLQGDELLILFAVGPLIAALGWFLTRTDAGLAVRAAAENADRARTLGIPVGRLTTLAWGVAGALAALTYILKAPFTGVTPGVASAGATVLLPPLAAAVVAGMESIPGAFAAGVAFGVVEQVVAWNSSGTPSLQYVVFFAAVELHGRLGHAEGIDALLDNRLRLIGRLLANLVRGARLQVERDRRRVGARRHVPVIGVEISEQLVPNLTLPRGVRR